MIEYCYTPIIVTDNKANIIFQNKSFTKIMKNLGFNDKSENFRIKNFYSILDGYS